MPTLDTLQLPRIDTSVYGGREAKKLASHLYQVEEQLRYVLGHLDEDNLSDGLVSKIESGGLSSEILQTLDAITLRVSGQDDAMAELRVTLTGVRSTVQEQGGAISELEQTAQGLVTTVAKNQEELRSEIRQTVEALQLSVENGETVSTLRLMAGEAELSSGVIELTGMVTFKDLAEENGRTVINGSNITTGEIDADLIKTGVIESTGGNTRYDLATGSIRSGPSSSTRFEIDANKINWYAGNYLTGVLYSVYGTSYLGANSRYVNYGWVNSGTPNAYVGLQFDHEYNIHGQPTRAVFNTSVVDVSNGNFGVNGRIDCNELYINGTAAKNAVVPTGYGALKLCATESPAPCFHDWGGGACGKDGTCFLALDERYLAVIEPRQARRWLLTDTSGGGPLWVEDGPAGATVHGAPGQTFDWVCFAAQRGAGGLYAEPYDGKNTACIPDTPQVLQIAMYETLTEEENLEKLLQEEIA